MRRSSRLSFAAAPPAAAPPAGRCRCRLRPAAARRQARYRSLVRRFEFGQAVGLVLGHQGIDDLAQLVARNDARQIVERQVDAMVGDPALRKIISADALAAVARADHALALGGTGAIHPLPLDVIKLGLE